jgi:hypothetical protein
MAGAPLMVVQVKLTVAPEGRVVSTPLGDALRALRRVEVEAPSVEVGEHYAQLLLDALTTAANLVDAAVRPGRR